MKKRHPVLEDEIHVILIGKDAVLQILHVHQRRKNALIQSDPVAVEQNDARTEVVVARKGVHRLLGIFCLSNRNFGMSFKFQKNSKISYGRDEIFTQIHLEKRRYVRKGACVRVKIENTPINEARNVQARKYRPGPSPLPLLARQQVFKIMEDEIRRAVAPATLFNDFLGISRKFVAEDVHSHRQRRVLQNRQHRDHGVRKVGCVGGEGELYVGHRGHSVKARMGLTPPIRAGRGVWRAAYRLRHKSASRTEGIRQGRSLGGGP